MTETVTITMSADVVVDAVAEAIGKTLRKLPRETREDGTQWVSAELLDELATKLETRKSAP